jgi:alkylation response protein AidB-like acyl-CoA dehydrogenase
VHYVDYFLTEEQRMLKELARKIAEEKVMPVRAELDEKEEFPWEMMHICAEAGLFGVSLPEEYGGFGGGVFENCMVIEELSRACIGVSVSFAGSGLGAYPILLYGTEEQKKKYLPEIGSGKKIGAFGATEANAGSDVAGMQTTARKDGDGYILNGTKQWITNGGEAEIYSVFAVTDKKRGPRGISGFIVEKGMEGFSFGKKEKKLGIRTSATRELVFEDCRVPRENLIGGREGIGLIMILKTFDMSRPSIGAQAVGLAQGAFETAARYTRERVQFGQKIISFQAVQHMLADMATQIEAARALVYAVARYVDSNPRSFSKESAMTKLFPSDMAMRVTVDAVQLLGGYGYMRDFPVEKMMRDAKILQIYEGTNQIQRNNIAMELIKEIASGRM